MNLKLLTDDEFELLDSAISLKISQSTDLYYSSWGVGPFKEDIAKGERLRSKVNHIRPACAGPHAKKGRA